ncbi:glutaminyl-tRNA synthase (glutamine-hydrolyzing) subunit A [Candidatus Woesebacteria bacterium RIFOXYC1_FULL_31_51]|uniref:Glutamyl-tRNA(Gln) amidotransferase subunit A n=1 Tax=Candidatus Woesebacteria bacterium GW2011_GWC2_31_9 TaxID=1618586 RepID=A0A0F9YZR6_9BACT|nr:MAG: aspartyl/glutamyl-tRNA amidotransferase subunit A, aspartyl-tRNA(Asn)/glutamyl-tRNA (Gln) amidotransferase subunit A [Candidatus Woesebacteria bacterium GW2011_GWF1_31_35]KKP23641.1 MAG: aspartyl/glutamyl-tRNA amidotransferase subunit A [Candidatus Woesebacteria bacterium GW2011_GWC1_30_29]KKP26978.1 MAG: aspartyl/glutamyl-tRNA amidotransferase subunit A [Candidatus Woesebacteria bacterium GW2011_GWD1_31_12]KKP27916.1 MAG: aspartyl/glutamyl-tRNA amidotransferase subunit A [Candidatus Woe
MNLPLTIKETQEGLKSKKFSAVELVDTYLEKIKKYNDEYKIFLTINEEGAYKKAKEIDNSDFTLPLFGVVGSYKDIFLTKGIRTTAGSKILENFIPPYSATIVKKLENAGVISIGKLNCDAFAHGSSGENSDFGTTLNPWNKEYTAGGSSSGSGAALSSGMSLISIGTDTCGSIRLPANYGYLFSLKPTYGAVSRYGVIAMASSLDTVGPLAHTVSDVETVFNVIKGKDYLDATVTEKSINNKNSKFKIGIPKEFFVGGLSKEIEKNIGEVIKIYKNENVEFIDVSLPSTKYGISVYYIIQPAEVSSNLSRFDGIRYGGLRDSFGEEAKRRIMLGSYVLSAGFYDAYYEKAMKVRTIIKNEVDSIFTKVDALIAPVAPTPAFKLGEKTNDPLSMYLTDIYAATANLSGIPAIAIPSGFSDKKLPLGFQLMAPRFGEDILFKLGKIFELATDYKPKVAF